MDPNAVVAAQAPTGFVEWITQYGNIVAFVAQIVYWTAIIVLLAYAVWQYKRWVNYQLGTGRSGRLRTGGTNNVSVEPADKPISVEEFVE